MKLTGLKVSTGFPWGSSPDVAQRGGETGTVKPVCCCRRQFPCQWMFLVLLFLLNVAYHGAEGKDGRVCKSTPLHVSRRE